MQTTSSVAAPRPVAAPRQSAAHSPLIHICMICHRRLAPNQHAVGSPLALDRSLNLSLSHGLCLDCLPGYGRTLGLSEDQIARIAEVSVIN